jgi:hypothetical protein
VQKIIKTANTQTGCPHKATTYYLWYRITNVGARNLSRYAMLAAPEVDVAGATGECGVLGFLGATPPSPCTPTNPPKFFTIGKTWATCDSETYLGGELVGAEYGNSFAPVVWTLPASHH